MATRRKRRASSIVALVVALAAAISLLAAGGVGAGSRSAFALPRAQTFYMSGSAVGTVRRCEPRQDVGLLDGHGRTRLRDRLPFQPADGQLHPVARHERNVAHEDSVRHDDPRRCQVQRRKDTDAEGREVQLRPSQDRDPPPERAVGDYRAPERSGRPEHRRLHIRREAGIPAVRLLSLQRRDRSAARLQQVQQDGPHDRQPGCE